MTTNRHFIIAGAQRSATTYLWQALHAHPDVQMAAPVRPEPKFFLKSEEFTEGYEGYIRRYFPKPVSDVPYILGEKSTSYIEHPIAARRIAKTLPDVRLIFMLRNPIERAISNVRFSTMHGFETESLETALLRELESPEDVLTMGETGVSVSPQAYLARGAYVHQLTYYYELFEPAQIHLEISERFTADPSRIEGIYNFIGVDTDFEPGSLNSVVNASDKKGDAELSDKILRRLKAHFAPLNAELANLTRLDLSEWA